MSENTAIDNRYILGECIKVGGFGIVHKGYDIKLDMSPVAIKKIHPYFVSDQKFIDMFLDEAITTAKLRHPNIVTIYDLRTTRDNQIYIIMEFIEGIDLRSLIDICQNKNQPIPRDLGVYIVGQICKALGYAHEKRHPLSKEPLHIIHRDISPSNIMITTEGTVKVIDFGIAKARDRKSDKTEFGIIKGKTNYLSPEQIDGKVIDHRSDLFSLGIVMFEIISGEKLFFGKTSRSLLNMVAESRIDLSRFEKHKIPADLKRIILKAVEKEPAARYQNAREIYEDVHLYLQQVSQTDLNYRLSEFVRPIYFEMHEQKKTEESVNLEIGEETIHIATDSISSVLKKKEPAPIPEPTPVYEADDDKIDILDENDRRRKDVAKIIININDQIRRFRNSFISYFKNFISKKPGWQLNNIGVYVLSAIFILVVLLFFKGWWRQPASEPGDDPATAISVVSPDTIQNDSTTMINSNNQDSTDLDQLIVEMEETKKNATIRKPIVAKKPRFNLTIHSTPDSSKIAIYNGYKKSLIPGIQGKYTPFQIRLEQGTYTVVASSMNTNFKNAEKVFKITGDTNIDLIHENRTLKIEFFSVPEKSYISLDGIPQGKTPTTLKIMHQGNYQVKLESVGYQPTTVAINFPAGEDFVHIDGTKKTIPAYDRKISIRRFLKGLPINCTFELYKPGKLFILDESKYPKNLDWQTEVDCKDIAIGFHDIAVWWKGNYSDTLVDFEIKPIKDYHYMIDEVAVVKHKRMK